MHGHMNVKFSCYIYEHLGDKTKDLRFKFRPMPVFAGAGWVTKEICQWYGRQ
jgi:hypothetical protein